ncbi:unnamed protein product [Arabidopsis thaliana]|uniref:(thale cress) hypothetical protein n=1 Tax=Arabidopsis thaliana TaxID=3702 RepID=A0A5S9Y836_ARATH|nr:unnamed protein product [Arabidopsis thaliana]CAD5332793.1 unnamed protein product [Arabidopsis thaliana]
MDTCMKAWCPLQEHFLPRKASKESWTGSAMDFDYAHYALTEGRKAKVDDYEVTSLSRKAYMKQSAEGYDEFESYLDSRFQKQTSSTVS